MSVRITLVTAVNFGPFPHAQYRLDLPGLTGIEGTITWQNGLTDSNGSGKSMLLEAPVWCLWGKGIRSGLQGDAVIRRGAPKGEGTCVTVRILKDEGPEELVVTRYRKHPNGKDRLRVEVTGEDVTLGTNAATQEMLNDILGIDYDAFLSSVAFGARDDVRSFFVATDVERKRILERLLNLDRFSAARDLAAQRLKEAKAAEGEALDAYHVAHKALEAAQEATGATEAATLRVEIEAALKDRRARRALLQRHIQEKADAHEVAMDEYEVLKERQAAADAEHKAAQGQWGTVATKLAQAETAAESACVSAETALGKAQAALDGLDEDPEACPTCGQSTPEEVMASIRSEHETAVEEATVALTSAVEELAVAQQRLAQHSFLQPERPIVPGLRTAYAYTQALWAEYQELNLLDSSLEHSIDSFTSQLAAIGATTVSSASIEKLEEERAEAETARTVAVNAADRAGFWVEGFGTQGVRSLLIEAEIPAINDLATKFARMLLDPNAHVRLRATTKLKGSDEHREKISIEAEIPGCCSSYESASRGQRTRLDLALLLALREVVASRNSHSFDQFFADELFDGLDKSGCEAAVELLRELSETTPVTLVTHSPWLQNVADRVLRVESTGPAMATVTLPETV